MHDSLKELFELGFSLIPLKGKTPIDLNWTKAPRKEWGEIKRLKAQGANVGVRLGSASKIGGGYLAVIDCDVKSTEARHERELLAWLERELPGFPEDAPCVLSGRGYGSRHLYFLTDKPVAPRRLTQSAETVKVFMPSSKKPSKRDRDNLTPEELEKGMRLRAAWEISLMGEGQQVVLPPSIHPDSKKPYIWRKTLSESKGFGRVWDSNDALLAGNSEEKPETLVSSVNNLAQFEKVDLIFTRLDPKVIALIEEGDGCEDRSGALLSAGMAMVRAGMSDAEILSVLTDPDYFLGEAAYDHAQTTDRVKAARWIERYTLLKARSLADPSNQFDGVEMEEAPLSMEEAEAQMREIEEASGDWTTLIERVGGKEDAPPKQTLKNLLLIFSRGIDKHLFRFNEFAYCEVYGAVPPWGGSVGAEIRDVDLLLAKKWLADNFRMEPNTNLINEAVRVIANEARFHPVKDFLEGLEWDGVGRIDTWLKDYMGAEGPEEYLRAVSRKVLCALVARVMEPGIKFDHVLILEGLQGIGKSTALSIIAGPEWFSDAHINVADKDAIVNMTGKWLVEMGELSGMKKADVDQMKEFISRTVDRVRLPYGRRAENFPRQCVFVGTTNNDEYMKDDTGNRRFWPVVTHSVDLVGLRAVREQLLAEAVATWALGEPLYLEGEGAKKAAEEEQEKRLEEDGFTQILREWIEREDEGKKARKEALMRGVSISEMFKFFDSDNVSPVTSVTPKFDMQGQKRVAKALRALGFEKRVKRVGGQFGKVWVLPEGNVTRRKG